MIVSRSFLVSTFTLASIVTSVSASLPGELLVKRQNDTIGTNLYNCHDNCGKEFYD